MLAEIATLHGEVADAQRLFGAALEVFKKYPCPTVEWRILARAGDLAELRKKSDEAGDLHGQARSVVCALADSVSNDKLRDHLLQSKAAERLGLA